MKRRVKIIPAVLAQNSVGFRKQWHKIAQYFKHVQVDIMDGVFVSSKNNINPRTIQPIVKNHKLEIHLMVKDVPQYVMTWIKLRNVKKIIWHYEADKNIDHIKSLNTYIKQQGIQTGLCLNPNTSLAKIKNIINDFNTIQLMGIKPGAQGRTFQTKILEKIKGLRSKYPNLNIAIDGGVNEKNFKTIKKAGANILCLGSYLQQSNNLKKDLEKLN